MANIGAVFSPILGLIDAGELLTGERRVVPFPVRSLDDVVGGIANAPPQLNMASIGVGLLRSEETAEACTCVDKLGQVGRRGAFAVDDARIVGVRHNDESGGVGVKEVTATS